MNSDLFDVLHYIHHHAGVEYMNIPNGMAYGVMVDKQTHLDKYKAITAKFNVSVNIHKDIVILKS